jgi:hypothetical protein
MVCGPMIAEVTPGWAIANQGGARTGANNHDGDIFITPTGDQTTYANGPEIIDNHGLGAG